MKVKSQTIKAVFSLVLALVLSGCATSPPRQQNNLCEIFRQKPSWYEDALDMNEKWETPINVAMAFIKQESSFVHNAKPPRYYALGFIPWGRVSSAYGYPQAQDPVWSEYQDQVSSWSSRDDFGDAIDFVGWYTDQSQKKLGISKWDPYHQYLAYHEGLGGYKRKSYTYKPSLLIVARRVEQTAKDYGWQLKQCQAELEDNRSWFF